MNTIPCSWYFSLSYTPEAAELVSKLEAGFEPWPIETRAWQLTTPANGKTMEEDCGKFCK